MSDVNFRELRHAPAMPVNFAKAVMRARVKPGKTRNCPMSACASTMWA